MLLLIILLYNLIKDSTNILLVLKIFFSFLLLVFFLVFLFSFGFVGLSIAPWVPSRRKDRERINKLANLKAGQVFYELGCGGGGVCRHIAKKNPGAKVIGIELSTPVFIVAKLRGLFGPKNMEIRFGNALKADLSDGDVLFTFALTDSINKKLKPKSYKELKSGAKVLSYVFEINDWKGKVRVDKPSDKSFSIFTYEL